jgi:hypothetical protein
MNTTMAEAKDISSDASPNAAHPQPRGFIAFCETNQRYEGGRKAWLFLGPYFFGAYIWYATINEGQTEPQKHILPWLGFIAYLVLFPSIWKWVLKLVTPKRAQISTVPDSSLNTIQSFTSQVDEKIKPSGQAE